MAGRRRGAAREGRASRGGDPPVLRRRWRGARPGSGWVRVVRRRVRSRPAPRRPPAIAHGPQHSHIRSRVSSMRGMHRIKEGDVGHPRAARSVDRPRPCAPLRSDGCPPSTRGRSTRWSSGGLAPAKGKRSVISRWGSHLDALSGSPIPTWLPGGAASATTGTPAVGPARSSRTRASAGHASIRPRRIETELSHDVLNPARVPL
jgi:hypothetical protein